MQNESVLRKQLNLVEEQWRMEQEKGLKLSETFEFFSTTFGFSFQEKENKTYIFPCTEYTVWMENFFGLLIRVLANKCMITNTICPCNLESH